MKYLLFLAGPDGRRTFLRGFEYKAILNAAIKVLDRVDDSETEHAENFQRALGDPAENAYRDADWPGGSDSDDKTERPYGLTVVEIDANGEFISETKLRPWAYYDPKEGPKAAEEETEYRLD